MARRYGTSLVRTGQTERSDSEPLSRVFPEVRQLRSPTSRLTKKLPRWMSTAALDLAETLLSYDPSNRATAAQALEAPYFTQEFPRPELPVGWVFLPSSLSAY
jgi:hypothetical protein